ncbi:hypothetical protein HOC35_03755 [Candidatus Woesearchaeota archaeon]|jgi:hypothetical protein|nr:hypothetical protein [Candidatus Woesearchaeota archaeon]
MPSYGIAQRFLIWLEHAGLTDAILPFLLIFTVIFAVFQKTNIFGENKKNMNVMVALFMSLMTVVPHVMGRYPANADPVLIMNQALPNISVLAVAIIMGLLLIGIFGGKASWIGGTFSGIIALMAFASIVYFFGSAAGWWTSFHGGWWNSDVTVAIIVILIFALIIWFITKEESTSQSTGALRNVIDEVGNFFKGGGGK